MSTDTTESVAEAVADVEETGWVTLPLEAAKTALENWHDGGAAALDALFGEAAES